MKTSSGASPEAAGKKSKVSSGLSPHCKSFWQTSACSALRLRSAYSARNGSIEGTQLLGEYSFSIRTSGQLRQAWSFGFILPSQISASDSALTEVSESTQKSLPIVGGL